jgi:exopolysaccharide production protein ExoZ
VKRFAYIDALRGYAILGVIIVHCAGVAVPFAASGARGVQLFFVASALALSVAWHAHGDGTGAFFVRRIFRIAPMFWLMIAVTYIVNSVTATGDLASPSQITASVFLVHGIAPVLANATVPGASTIAVEVSFYVVFPLLITIVTTWQRALIGLLLAIVFAASAWPGLVAYASMTTPDPLDAKNFAFMSLPTQAPCFFMGMLVYQLIKLDRAPAWISTSAGVACVTLLAAIPFVSTSPSVYLAYVLAFGAGAYSLAQRRSHFVNRAICFMGIISYSAYFWHFLVLRALHYILVDWSFPALFAVTLAITVLLSAGTYIGLEKPMMAAGSRLARRIRAIPDAMQVDSVRNASQ